MQIIIGRNTQSEFALGLTYSRMFLKSTPFKMTWKYINGFRVHFRDKVWFIEFWNKTYPKRGLVVHLYRRRSA